jgi:hypothetical protein
MEAPQSGEVYDFANSGQPLTANIVRPDVPTPAQQSIERAQTDPGTLNNVSSKAVIDHVMSSYGPPVVLQEPNEPLTPLSPDAFIAPGVQTPSSQEDLFIRSSAFSG